ncbi:MAG: IMP cyclohydrolase [Coriobacteriales bacterium]|nr:IMP cyclohydrolase [Coriobacteriales bacterium]
MQDLTDLLKNNPYPGRGIAIGSGRVYYFIMGRSANSRNRIFSTTRDGIRTEAHKPELVEDPSLIIYHPVRTMGSSLVVTNGDQTDTIVEQHDFVRGCLMREYEPDAPNFTPRISSILNQDGSFALSILKRQGALFSEGADNSCLREFFFSEGTEDGTGYFLSTYVGDGDPLPSFAGEPIPVRMGEPDDVWAALNEDNKISLYCNVHGDVTIYNKHLGD